VIGKQSSGLAPVDVAMPAGPHAAASANAREAAAARASALGGQSRPSSSAHLASELDCCNAQQYSQMNLSIITRNDGVAESFAVMAIESV